MTDFAAQRRNMVDGQVRIADVTDHALLAAMLDVPRERFVPAASAGIAYLDIDIPLGGQRRLLKPMVLAKLLQAAAVGPSDTVLDAGAGGGYAAAVLARMAGTVVALEEDAGLAAAARTSLAGITNVTVVQGAIADGAATQGPYDIIVLEGACEVSPQALCRQLKDGGRLVCVRGTGPDAKATIFRRSGDDIGELAIFDATAALIPGLAKAPAFAF